MEMIWRTCTSSPPEVNTNIETIGTVRFGKNYLCSLGQRRQLVQLRLMQVGQSADMTIRNNHEMAIVIGKFIENNEAMSPSMQD